jgi:glutathione S-transferase
VIVALVDPFGKIPAFEHTGFRLYEAGAITRYTSTRHLAVVLSNPPIHEAVPA